MFNLKKVTILIFDFAVHFTNSKSSEVCTCKCDVIITLFDNSHVYFWSESLKLISTIMNIVEHFHCLIS